MGMAKTKPAKLSFSESVLPLFHYHHITTSHSNSKVCFFSLQVQVLLSFVSFSEQLTKNSALNFLILYARVKLLSQNKLSIRLCSFCHYSLLEFFYRIIFSCATIFIATVLNITVFGNTRSTKLIQLVDVFLKTNTL